MEAEQHSKPPKKRQIIARYLKEFLALEAAGGLIMIAFAAIALLLANSSFSEQYFGIIKAPVTVGFADYSYSYPLSGWIKNLAMAIFFLLVGLEIKREIMEGALSSRDQLMLPLVCALGGMAMPALIYLAINFPYPDTIHGWAIPTATDIAFAVCVLNLIRGVPVSLKIFLLALAIIDDLGAVVIIALFYSNELNLVWLGISSGVCLLLYALNRAYITNLTIYFLIGAVLWICILNAGISPTLAGVLLGCFIPLKESESKKSPLKSMVHSIHPFVSYLILPVFALSSAGVHIGGITAEALFSPVPLGVALGLFIGKQLGVFGSFWLLVKIRVVKMPENTNWLQIYGISILTGIGFTMSLFVSLLAFSSELLKEEAKIGILIGSLTSAFYGYFILKSACRRNNN